VAIFLFTVAGGLPEHLCRGGAAGAVPSKANYLALHAVLSVVAPGSWTWSPIPSLRCATRTPTNGESETDDKPAGGLLFPDDDAPDYYDFAYFSFVIGMTSSVDVQLTPSACALRHWCTGRSRFALTR